MERPNGKHKRRRVGSLPPHDEGERLTASPHPPRCSSAASCTRAADSGSTGGGLPGGRLAWTHADCSSAAMVLHHDLWLALCPNLSVTDGNGAVRTRLDEKPGEEGSSTTTQPGTATTFDGRNPRASAAADSVRTHGHCAFPVSDVEAAEHEQVAATTSAPTVAAALRPSLPTDVVPRLAEGMKNLVSQGWHPVWAFVYDEAWELFQAVGRHVLPSINPLLKLNWDCWAWYLDPSSIPLPRGFLPHRDRTLMPFSETQEPAYFTMWIALTDATLDNGYWNTEPVQNRTKTAAAFVFGWGRSFCLRCFCCVVVGFYLFSAVLARFTFVAALHTDVFGCCRQQLIQNTSLKAGAGNVGWGAGERQHGDPS
eukprot:m.145549 g.145549  ORF g.145549 m.145549 type:complete len:368 (-) comp17226_c0_seq1:656-1759(-)